MARRHRHVRALAVTSLNVPCLLDSPKTISTNSSEGCTVFGRRTPPECSGRLSARPIQQFPGVRASDTSIFTLAPALNFHRLLEGVWRAALKTY
jgi:hypothetical protein